MRCTVLILILGLLGVAAAPVSTPAQDVFTQVQVEIERTDHRIERAETLVGAADNEQARFELSEAKRLQAEAKRALSESHPRIALDLTFRARARADRAIALISGLPDPDRVLAQLERTRELVDRARELIEDCGQDRARSLLQAATDMQRRAEEAARGGHYLGALQLTMGARERVHRALRMCRVAENERAAAERALKRTDDVIQQAQDRLSSGAPENARPMLGQAMETQKRAEQEFREERFESSIRFTLSARALAFRVLRMTGGF